MCINFEIFIIDIVMVILGTKCIHCYNDVECAKVQHFLTSEYYVDSLVSLFSNVTISHSEVAGLIFRCTTH